MENKRGRKPKNAVFENGPDSPVANTDNPFSASIEKAPKKRGRPKTKNLDAPTQPKGTGKRGRKPKERVYAYIETSTNPFQGEEQENSDSDNEALILQIPHDAESRITTISTDDAEPVPFEHPKPRFSSYDKKALSDIQNCIENLPSKLEDIEKEREKEAKKYMKHLSSKDVATAFPVQELFNEQNYKKEKIDFNFDNSFNKDTKIKTSTIENNESNDQLFQKRTNHVDKYMTKFDAKITYTSEYSLLPEFRQSTITGKLPTSTTVCCWWDTYPFDTQPVCYPTKYSLNNTFDINIIDSRVNPETIKVKNYGEFPIGKYFVSGCFCSYNCLLAYIKTNKTIPQNTEQLLHTMYKDIHKQSFKIKPAPPYQSLTRFGGPLTIKKFRESFDCIDYSLLRIPLISVLPTLEEKETCTNNYSDNSNNIIIESIGPSSKVPQNKENCLRLKRSKPLKGSKGTLENFMNIQVI